MKRFLLAAIVALCGLSASAQWNAGLRLGSAFEAVAQYEFSRASYFEGRFGMFYGNPGGTVMANFTALYNWRLAEMNWTSGTGPWFFDAGLGVNVGGREHYAYVGVALMARLGVEVTSNIKLALDWTPAFGPEFAYGHHHTHTDFYKYGLADCGVSFIYSF